MTTIKLHILFALITLCSLASQAQVNVIDSLQVILKDSNVETETRFRNAYNLIFFNSSLEEAQSLAMGVVYPFVEESWETDSEQRSHLARLYLLISFCYRERGADNRNEMERFYVEKALETAKESNDDAVCARCSMSCAYMELKRGDVKKGHEYLYQAIDYYDKIEQYVKSSEMLYVIVSNFIEIKDLDGIQRVLGQMEEYLKKDNSKQSLYQYNVIKHSYFGLLLEKEKANKETVDYQLVDSSMLYINKNVDLTENFLAELSPHWMHGYAYYFLAKELDLYYPQQTDAILLNLDKALEMLEYESISRMNEANSVMELKAYVAQVRANTLLRIEKKHEAFESMSEALALLDELKNYKNLSLSRNTAYQFMVEYYEKINQPAEALKFQKLIQENEAQRYENEKVQAINEMSAKYETEKKETRIQTLIKENKTAQRILLLTLGLLLTLLVIFLLIFISSRLKRKNIEQKLYETALHAELSQNELEKMQNLKQHLEQNPVTNMIEQIVQMISSSYIEKENKKIYLDRLSKIDPKLLENVYQTSTAKITNMDMKYIICFVADIDVKDISLLFNIEPASVHTVRYRIKKKLPKDDAFRVIL